MDEGEEKLGSLKTFGTEYFKDSFFNKPKKIEPVHYGRYNLQVARHARTGHIYTLDIKESCRIIILGATRSGKTWFMRTIGDRLFKIGDDVVYLTDIKNEFFSSNQAVQEKFRDGLLDGEEPSTTKVITLRPTFFKQVSPTLDKQNYWYSVDSRKLTKADFMTLMNAQEMSSTQKTSMELIFQEIQKKMSVNEELQLNYDLLEEIIEEEPDIEPRQKKTMRFKFKPLQSSNFFETEHTKSIVNLLKNGYVPAINLENFDSFGQGGFLFPEVLLNIALREIIIARRAKKIKKVWIFLDEASRFLGKSKDTSIKSSVLESFDLDTRYGVNYVTAWQSISDVPERMLQQSRYIFVPQTADVGTIKDTLINTGMVKNIQRSMNKAMELKRLLKSAKYSWIIIDRMESRMDLVVPLPPLSWHLESSK